jgi:hypothetical protein
MMPPDAEVAPGGATDQSALDKQLTPKSTEGMTVEEAFDIALDWAKQGVDAMPCILSLNADDTIKKRPARGSDGHHGAHRDLDGLR